MVQIIYEVNVDGKMVKLQEPLVRVQTAEGETLTLTEDEADDLCIELESVLYDEPTYAELEDENVGLRQKAEELERELEYYREEPVKFVAVRL